MGKHLSSWRNGRDPARLRNRPWAQRYRAGLLGALRQRRARARHVLQPHQKKGFPMNLAALQLVASVVSRILDAVHVAEQVFPNAGSGVQKMEHVLTRAEEIIAGAPAKLEQLLPIAEKVKPLVTGLVDWLNKTGLFTHGPHNVTDTGLGQALPDFSSPGTRNAAGATETDAPA